MLRFSSVVMVLLTNVLLVTHGQAATITNNANSKAVNGVRWHKVANVNAAQLVSQPTPNQTARVIFLRRADRDSLQTSANLAINDRFQVSLQPGNYSQAYVCPGMNQLSVQIAGAKSNDLLKNSKTFNLAANQTYYFDVDVNEQGVSTLTQITPDSALANLKNMNYQSHQVSRVVPNCPLPAVPAKHTTVSPVIVETQSPVLAEKVTIDLEVLFETDKAIVRPEYYSKITELAEFTKKYPNTVVTIEGHTDNRGKEDYNQALSQRRANAVKEVLITQFGVATERLNSVGYGESQPRASNDTVEGRQLNRRVVAVVEERARN